MVHAPQDRACGDRVTNERALIWRGAGPGPNTAVRNGLLLALAPGIVLRLAISAIGKLYTGPLKSWDHSESDLNRSLQDTRSQTWDFVAAIWSRIGNTEIIIGLI